MYRHRFEHIIRQEIDHLREGCMVYCLVRGGVQIVVKVALLYQSSVSGELMCVSKLCSSHAQNNMPNEHTSNDTTPFAPRT